MWYIQPIFKIPQSYSFVLLNVSNYLQFLNLLLRNDQYIVSKYKLLYVNMVDIYILNIKWDFIIKLL